MRRAETGAAAKRQAFCGRYFVSALRIQCIDNHATLQRYNCTFKTRFIHCSVGWHRAQHLLGNKFQSENRIMIENDQTLDQILQLSHIAGPIILLQNFN